MKLLYVLFVFIFSALGIQKSTQENPWTESQLMAPEVLAKKITDNNLKNTLILSIGYAGVIKNSVEMGPASDSEDLAKLKSYLKNVKKDKEIVIYCGCCPFSHCPNIRPAFSTLKEMGFKNIHLLNLKNNVKTDWLDQNYPSNN